MIEEIISEKNIEAAAATHVRNHKDKEVRLMYGHSVRLFMAGANYVSSKITQDYRNKMRSELVKKPKIEMQRDELLTALKDLHSNSLYRLNEYDVRPNYLSARLYDQVEQAITNATK